MEMATQRLKQLVQFYSILDDLEAAIGGARTLADCSGRMGWPDRGVYFFREAGENRSGKGEKPRIVRVGTHALTAGSGTKLWTRLSQHRGQSSTGGGNHGGSIFRLIVGAALIRRDGLKCPTWGNRNTAEKSAELPLEREVTRVIGAMPLLWVPIEDEPGRESHRGYIERNAIALLSNSNKPPLDPPSEDWLGRHSDRERVRKSGLWNQNHVDESCDPAFLDLLAQLVSHARRAA
jgi:hypothetical protein